MKYFLSVNYLEDELHQKILGINIPMFLSKKMQQLQLISIGIVSEDLTEEVYSVSLDGLSAGMMDAIKHNCTTNVVKEKGKEYYAICKDFDLKAAWNNEWLRENVLKPIYDELSDLEIETCEQAKRQNISLKFKYNFTIKGVRKLINKYGKTRKQIAEEIKEFVDYKERPEFGKGVTTGNHLGVAFGVIPDYSKPEFYAYNADYDWVCFCWLFGRMIDLPRGFPMHCKALKQDLDKVAKEYVNTYNTKDGLKLVKALPNYPKQSNEHNALADAKWDKELHKFITNL